MYFARDGPGRSPIPAAGLFFRGYAPLFGSSGYGRAKNVPGRGSCGSGPVSRHHDRGPGSVVTPLQNYGAVVGSIPGGGGFWLFPPRREKTPKNRQKSGKTAPARPRPVFSSPRLSAHPGRGRDSGEILALSRTRTRSSASRMSTTNRLDCRHPSLSPYVYCSTVRAKSRTESDTTKMLLTVRIVVSHLHRCISSLPKIWIRFLRDRPRAGCAARHPLLYYPGSEHSGAKSPASGAAVWEIRPRFE